ncbi:MAG TPA: hypothetical protein VJA18_04505 [Candidatus Nanoarchaeia archaeon]|nr:hypothetical protein [Candidatus Nanoarchaeia archaeon]
MELSAILGVLLLVVMIFLVVKTIINSIRLFFFILVAIFFLVLFFGVSLSDVSVWLSSQERLQWAIHTLVNTLLFSLGS